MSSQRIDETLKVLHITDGIMSSSSPEKVVWKASPSQLIAFNFYAVCVLIVIGLIGLSYFAFTQQWSGIAYYPLYAIAIVLLVAVGKYVLVRSTSYELSNERLIMQYGLLSRESEEIELYRVRDWSVSQPLLLRMAGQGHIIVQSHDSTAPTLTLAGIGKVNEVKDRLRKLVEAARDKKSVRHLDVDGGGADVE